MAKTKEEKREYDRKRREEKREILNAQSREYYQKNRDARIAYINEYSNRLVIEKKKIANELKSNPCTDCGNIFPTECMDFDHLPQFVKGGGIGSYVFNRRVGINAFMREIAKCELVCANCHRTRTKNRNDYTKGR